jgi:hypothetical protein
MLVLSSSQLQELHARREPASDLALVRYARSRFGEHLASSSDESLLAGVRMARQYARRWGIEEESGVACVFDLMVMYGSRFGDEAWAQDIVRNAALTGAQKVERLRARVRRTVPGF